MIDLTHILLALIAFLVIKYQQRKKHAERNIKTILKQDLKIMPTPSHLPIIGHLHLMRDYPLNPWEGFNAIREQWGDIVSLKMGSHSMILISTYELMNEVLIKKGDIFADRPFFPRHNIIFGGDKENSLALCNWSNTHRSRRKFCKRGIMPNKLSARNQLLETIITNNLRKFISSDCDKNITKNHLLFLTGDIFLKFLSNQEFSRDQDLQKFNYGCDFIFYDINQSYIFDFLPNLAIFGYNRLRELRSVSDFCRLFIDNNIFEPRLLKHLQGEAQANDYLDTIIEEHLAGSTPMTLDDYKVGFADLLAGHAAVTNILMRLLGYLTQDQKLQDMIHDEAKRANLNSLNQIPHLPVTEAALQETLRLASSPIVPHVAREDTSIGGFYVRKGSEVIFNNYGVNLSTDLWERPREFYPERFLEESEDGPRLVVPKYFIPFSVGQRQCLGSRMVETICMAAVANICLHFKLKANDDQLVRKLLEPKGSIALNPLETCYEIELCPRS